MQPDRALVYLEQDRPLAMVWPKPDGPFELTGPEAAIEMPQLGLRLELAELYQDLGETPALAG